MHQLDQQSIKRHNLRRIYDSITRQPGVSRAELAGALVLSKTTVSSLVDELMCGGYICETGTRESGRLGRRATGLTVYAAGNAVAVIHWQRTRLELALVDTGREVCYRTERLLRPDQDILDALCSAYRHLVETAGGRRLLGLLLVVPAVVDDGRKRIYSTVLTDIPDEAILPGLRERLPGIPIGVFNDTACYAVAEEVFGQADTDRYILVNINKGIGAALVMDGALLRGAGGMATQFGHYSIDPKGPPCPCGNRGCLELLAGEPALAERAAACGALGSFPGPDPISFLDVGRLLEAGDAGALRLAETLAWDLGYALGNLTALYNPQLIILGGRGTQLGNSFLELLRGRLNAQGFAYFVQSTRLRYSRLPDTAALQGAVAYYLNRHFDVSEGPQDEMYLS